MTDEGGDRGERGIGCPGADLGVACWDKGEGGVPQNGDCRGKKKDERANGERSTMEGGRGEARGEGNAGGGGVTRGGGAIGCAWMSGGAVGVREKCCERRKWRGK